MYLQIKTPTGYKDLSTIQVGDKVCAFDDAINKVEGIDLWTAETNDYENQGDFIYYLINNTYKFYKNQSIYVNDVINHVFMLQVGDIIYDEYDQDIVITSIEELTNETEWYRLTISGDHTYIVDNIILHNASRYWVGSGSSVNWNATGNTNWAGSSGGAGNQSVPTSADDVFFDSGSANKNATFSGLPGPPTNTILSFRKDSGYTGTITRSAVLTVAGNFTDNRAGAWAGTSGLTISAASSMTSDEVIWGAPLTLTGTNDKTIFGNWSVTLLTISGGSTTLNKSAGETLTATGGLSMGFGLDGNADIILTGGTWSGAFAFLCNSLTIAGNVAISTGTSIGTSLIYSSGTVTHTGTLTIGYSCTLNTAGITWSNIAINTVTTIATLNSLLTISGTLTLPTNSVNTTFTGTAGFTCATLAGGFSGANTLTLEGGVTYTVTSALNVNTTRIASIQTITSSSPTVKAILTLNSGATCNALANFTRIDASAGKTISTFNGTVTGCSNVISFNDMPVSGF